MSAPLQVGDTVRWWPDLHDDDEAVAFTTDRSVDGVIVETNGRHVRQLYVTAVNNWRGTRALLNWPSVDTLYDTTVSPGVIRACPAAAESRKIDTSAGPISVTADPTLKPDEMRMVAASRIEDCVPCPTCGKRGACDMTRHAIREARGPLDVKYDDVTLCDLLVLDERLRRGESTMRGPFDYQSPRSLTAVQRAAVSAHWSAQLRAKVAASKEAERRRVVLDTEDD